MAHTTDVLVVGSGLAGCAAARSAAEAGADVTLATKAERPEQSSSYWAQGGIAVSRGDPAAFKDDVIEASDGLADLEAVDVLVGEADTAVREVLIDELGVSFDGGADPEYAREAAHSEPRILHVDAATGRHVLVPFLERLSDHDRVEILEDTAALELLCAEGRVGGAVLARGGDPEPYRAAATVLATGGIGACYERTTNPATATGDGIAMAALSGAELADMEYVQFHPTAFAGDGAGTGTFLLSEAVRGEGALLRNGDGERFMPSYHEDAELAPRDVVARAVGRERARTGGVTLDVSPLSFAESFPELHAACVERGVDPETGDAGIPVAPAEHFLCGGIDVDTRGRSSLERLFAVGECACTGVHGANRLASTSLLEALVWGRRAGNTAAACRGVPDVEAPGFRDSDPALSDSFADEKLRRLRRVMGERVGIERTAAGLDRAVSALRRLKGELDAYARTRTSRSLYELRSACVTALLVARAAAANEESRGCHYRTEEPPVGAGTDADVDPDVDADAD